jgi:hypothetical protein
MRGVLAATMLVLAGAVSACATYYDDDYGYGRGGYGGYDYVGRGYDRLGNDCGVFRGRGGHRLDPWLACTREGQDIVRYRFDEDHDRSIGRETADRANIWFRRHADTNRDMRLTDNEIRAALVNAARHQGGY